MSQHKAKSAKPESQDSQAEPEKVELYEKWQRALAELENGRKRFEQERTALLRYGQTGLLSELLPVVDNFYRATEHIPPQQQEEAWVKGILYIQKNLLDVLEQHGVKEIPVKPGDSFDPETQEAIAGEASAEVEEGRVIRVANKGYFLHDRVLRPAQVIVSQAAGEADNLTN